MVSEWQDATLDDLVEIKHGFAFQSEFFRDEPPGDVLLTPGNFAIGGGFKADKLKFYSGPTPEEFVLAENDLLVTMTDLSKAADTLGYPAFVPPPGPGYRYLHNQRLGKLVVRPGAPIEKKFLFYVLRSREYRNEVIASATGTTVKHTSPGRIGKYRFKLPDVAEQRAIASILAAFDDKIELNRQTNRTLDAMARALFKSWFVNFDPVRAKAEGRDTGLSKAVDTLFPDSFDDSELGEIPEGWSVLTVADLATINARTLSRSDSLDVIDYIEISEVMRGHVGNVVRYLRGSEPNRARRRLQHGDTVLSMVRPDRGAYFLCLNPTDTLIASTGFAVVSPSDGNWAFMYSALTQPEMGERLGRLADGGAYPAIRPGAIERLQLAMPDSSELLSRFERFARPLFERSAQDRDESATLSILRDALLPKLLSGELRAKEKE